MFFSTATLTIALTRQLGINYLASKALMGISGVTDNFRNYLNSRGLEFIICRVTSNPSSLDLEIVKEYQEAMKKSIYGVPFLVIAFQGYLTASVLIDALEKTKEFTPQALIAYFENIKNYNFKGIMLNFDPKTCELLHDVWIDTGTGPWIHVKEES